VGVCMDRTFRVFWCHGGCCRVAWWPAWILNEISDGSECTAKKTVVNPKEREGRASSRQRLCPEEFFCQIFNFYSAGGPAASSGMRNPSPGCHRRSPLPRLTRLAWATRAVAAAGDRHNDSASPVAAHTRPGTAAAVGPVDVLAQLSPPAMRPSWNAAAMVPQTVVAAEDLLPSRTGMQETAAAAGRVVPATVTRPGRIRAGSRASKRAMASEMRASAPGAVATTRSSSVQDRAAAAGTTVTGTHVTPTRMPLNHPSSTVTANVAAAPRRLPVTSLVPLAPGAQGAPAGDREATSRRRFTGPPSQTTRPPDWQCVYLPTVRP
jgi:hypothetical protein